MFLLGRGWHRCMNGHQGGTVVANGPCPEPTPHCPSASEAASHILRIRCCRAPGPGGAEGKGCRRGGGAHRLPGDRHAGSLRVSPCDGVGRASVPTILSQTRAAMGPHACRLAHGHFRQALQTSSDGSPRVLLARCTPIIIKRGRAKGQEGWFGLSSEFGKLTECFFILGSGFPCFIQVLDNNRLQVH